MFSDALTVIPILNASGASLLLAFKSWSDLHFQRVNNSSKPRVATHGDQPYSHYRFAPLFISSQPNTPIPMSMTPYFIGVMWDHSLRRNLQ